MPRKPVALLALILLTAPALGQTADEACQPGAQLPYPLTEEIAQMAFELRGADLVPLDFVTPARNDPNYSPSEIADLIAQKRQDLRAGRAFISKLAALPQARRDVLLLSGLDYRINGTRPMINLTTFTTPAFVDLYLDVLERRGLTAQAGLIREALAAFSPEEDPMARYARWSDGSGTILDPALDEQLLNIEARFAPLRAQILQTAEAITRADPTLLAEVSEKASDIDEYAYLEWVQGRILDCAGDWYATVDHQDPFVALPRPQHDLAVLHIFMQEVLNGGTHQFFSNSSGGLAPEVYAVLLRADLPEHAAALQQEMDMLGRPYPRDRMLRNNVMDGFDDAQNAALNASTADMEDGKIFAAMQKIARDSGLLAQ